MWFETRNGCRHALARAAAGPLVGLGRSRIVWSQAPRLSRLPRPERPLFAVTEAMASREHFSHLGIAGGIETVHLLSGVQKGLLFDSLYASDPSLYVRQIELQLTGPVDPDHLQMAWNCVITRHAALRTAIMWDGLDEPVQMVKRVARIQICYFDWSTRDSQQTEQALVDRALVDLAQGFTLFKAPLMRLTLIRLSRASYVLIWTHHLIVLDTWSSALVLREVMSAYESLMRGAQPQFGESVSSYSSYIASLHETGDAASARYWRQVLAGFRRCSELPRDPTSRRARRPVYASVLAVRRMVLGSERLQAVRRLCGVAEIAPSTVIQGAWALQISAWAGETDVVFGLTASGRSSRFRNLNIVGQLANTVPFRVDTSGGQIISRWLRDLRSHELALVDHAAVPLSTIHRWSALPADQPLFESALAFDDLPCAPRSDERNGVEIAVRRSTVHTSYPLTLAVTAEGDGQIAIYFDPRRFDQMSIERVGNRLIRVVEQIAARPEGRLGDLESATDAERKQFLLDSPSAAAHVRELPKDATTRHGRSLSRNSTRDASGLFAAHRALSRDASGSARTSIERALTEIWLDVLGAEKVGSNDNFFDLGGDSLLSMKIVSRARQRGIWLTPQELFEHQTLAALAARAAAHLRRDAVDAAEACDDVPLTPIQRWFFERDLPDPNHFNQSFLLEPGVRLDAGLVERALAAITEHHDALRLRFVRARDQWDQQLVPLERPAFEHIDVRALTPSDQDILMVREALRLQTTLDLERGPLMRVALFELGRQRPQRLFIVLHHLIVDGVSWRIMLEDLGLALNQLRSGRRAELPRKTATYSEWARHLQDHTKAIWRREADYWLAQSERPPAFPRDYANGQNTLASARDVEVSLSAGETRALLRGAASHYRADINSVLLSALARAVAAVTNATRVAVDVEGHGRSVARIDVSRTVGWFTTIVPHVFTVEPREPHRVLIARTKQRFETLGEHVIGYGILRYGVGARHTKLRSLPKADIVFNYLGQFDQVLSDGHFGASALEPLAPDQSTRGTRTHLLEVNGIVMGSRMAFTFTYSENLHCDDTIIRLATVFVEALRECARECMHNTAGTGDLSA